MAEIIHHLGQDYPVGHLLPHVGAFDWTEGSDIRRFSVHVRYSPHCYSEGLTGEAPDGSFVFTDAGGRRAFSPQRHAHSLSVPGMINALIDKPTLRVSLTYESNWSIFALRMSPALAADELFYVFFRLRRSDPVALSDRLRSLELYVESAYARATKVAVREHRPFGAAVSAIFKK